MNKQLLSVKLKATREIIRLLGFKFVFLLHSQRTSWRKTPTEVSTSVIIMHFSCSTNQTRHDLLRNTIKMKEKKKGRISKNFPGRDESFASYFLVSEHKRWKHDALCCSFEKTKTNEKDPDTYFPLGDCGKKKKKSSRQKDFLSRYINLSMRQLSQKACLCLSKQGNPVFSSFTSK